MRPRMNLQIQILNVIAAQGFTTSPLLAEILDITRQGAHSHLRSMVDDGLLVATGNRRSTRYELAARRTSTYPIASTSEDEIWGLEKIALRTLAPDALEKNVFRVLSFSFTEMVNNALDHSKGSTIVIRWFTTETDVAFEVRDDGIGAFASIRESFELENNFQAIGMLSKGKQTTAPDRHSGLGIFFTSRLVERFTLTANDYSWIVDNGINDQAIASLSVPRTGTVVRCAIPFDTDNDLNRVAASVSDPITSRLNRTSLKVDLFREGLFVSRTEARLIGARLEGFEVVELDFTNVDFLGQGFADELFRVWQREHPETTLVVRNASPAITLMIDMVER